MRKYYFLLTSLWAGVVLGGSLIVAPAKFQVASLTIPQLLEVGRAQFQWVGIAEIIFAALLILPLFYPPIREKLSLGAKCFLLAALAALIVQQGFVMPPLSERTQSLIVGEPVGSSYLHLVFVAVEILKISMLVASCVLLSFKEKSDATLRY
ncbi:hypothetical protein GCM10007094_31620 [Pseudovibrio japonicus]|uniref:DUF4149 domain-containing protein n=1 Tax=Pseudovibrio japonicus TaxID=366534 RepID=A0ABQ3ELH7_9HYPH|nr:hypothetical protein [Pseudovibrio japonicus]GHB40015.1 hypothetical protein GCM10007094_31620 [Pseudovibrio japonicus]